MHNQGLLQKEIAEIAGCKPCTITNHLTKMGVYTYRKDLQPKMLELHEQGYYDKEIAYYVNADYGLLACTNYSVKNPIEGEYEYIVSCTPHISRVICGIVVWIAVIVLFACIMAGLFFSLHYIVDTKIKRLYFRDILIRIKLNLPSC